MATLKARLPAFTLEGPKGSRARLSLVDTSHVVTLKERSASLSVCVHNDSTTLDYDTTLRLRNWLNDWLGQHKETT